MHSVSLHKLDQSHMLLMCNLLNSAHVRMWWPSNKLWTVSDIEKKYFANLNPVVHRFIAFIGDDPIGYIQWYPFWHGTPFIPTFTKLVGPVAGIDLFIGSPRNAGKGYGTLMIQRLIADHLLSCFRTCLVDSDLRNIKAIRFFKRLGFQSFYNTDANRFMFLDLNKY